MAPSRFAAALGARTFTNGADAALVARLYGECVRAGFGEIERLLYQHCGWGDAQLVELGALLTEAPCPRVHVLKLTCHSMTRLAPLGAPIRAGALAGLRSLVLADCGALTTLDGAPLEQLPRLETLVLSGCPSLSKDLARREPPLRARLPPSLATLDVRNSVDEEHGEALRQLHASGVRVRTHLRLAEPLERTRAATDAAAAAVLSAADADATQDALSVRSATLMQAAERGRLARKLSAERREARRVWGLL